MSSLTKNNTSASSNYVWNSTDAGIRADFVSGSVSDKSGNRSPLATSKDSIHTLLYNGATTLCWAQYKTWFFPTSPHKPVGYDESQLATVQAQVQDMVSRGYNGIIVDYFGTTLYSSPMVSYVLNTVNLTPNFKLIMMLDANTPELVSSTNRTATMITLMKTMDSLFNGQLYYQHISGRPLILLRGMDAYTTINWNTVRSNITGLQRGNPLLVFDGAGGFVKGSPNVSDGAFVLPDYTKVTSSDPAALSNLTNFYRVAGLNPGKIVVGCAYKGFNDILAGGPGNSISQQSGQTWLSTFSTVASNFSSTNQLPYLQTSWNDYEQGQELEGGISSGLTMVGTISGTTLSWTIANATEASLVRYDLYETSDGGVTDNLLGSVAIGVPRRFTIPTLATGTHQISIAAVGKSHFQIRVSPFVSYVVATTPAPTVASISPVSGTTLGGTSVVITGTGFVSGATVTIGSAATGVTVVSSTLINAVTAANSAGVAAIVVTNPDLQTGTLNAAYTYRVPPSSPHLVSIAPTGGEAAGGTSVTITGTGFVSGCTVQFGGFQATSVVFVNSTLVTCLTPSGSGVVDVSVVNPDFQFSTLAGAYTYAVATLPAPTVTDIVPTHGGTTGGTAVSILGSDFVNGASVVIGSTATGVSFVDSSHLTATTVAHAAGAVDVVVVNPDVQTGTLTNGFTYITPPSLVSLLPTTGPDVGGTSVTLTGTGFVSGCTVTVRTAAGTGVVFIGPTSVSFTTPPGVAGAANVTLTNPDGQFSTLAGGFTYTSSGFPAPTLSSVTPNSGPLAGGNSVAIVGNNFQAGAVASFGGIAASTTFNSLTSLTVVVPAGSVVGSVDLVVTNTDAQSATLANGYTYVTSNSVLEVLSILPNIGPTTGGPAVTISGQGFVNGCTTTIGGLAVTHLVFFSETVLLGNLPAHAEGVVDVVVSNPGGGSVTLTAGYSYVPPETVLF